MAGPLPSTRMTNTVPNLPTVLLRHRGPHANPCYPGLPDFPRSRSLTPWRLEKHLLPRPDIWMEMKAGPAVSKAPKFPCPSCCLAGAKAGSTTLQPKEARSALRFGGLGQNKHPAGEKKALPHLTAASTVSCCSTAGLRPGARVDDGAGGKGKVQVSLGKLTTLSKPTTQLCLEIYPVKTTENLPKFSY